MTTTKNYVSPSMPLSVSRASRLYERHDTPEEDIVKISKASLCIVALVTVLAGLLVATPASADSTDLATKRFQTPSGNIHCLMQDGGLLRCDILSGLNPEPDKKCRLDWVGLLLPRAKAARPNCAGDTVADQSAPVLQYGERWERRGRRCISKRSGLYCTSYGGWHFKLSRDDWDTWYTP